MSKDFWIPLHSHSDESNAGGYWEVASKDENYINYAKEQGLPAICFTNHGNVARWIRHKELAEAAGIKFIHGIEAYVTMNLEDKNRGYHTIIIAKNYEGVKEINRLSSASFNRQDGHFYYRPRILFDDLVRILANGNIYVTTACLAGGIAQNLPRLDDEEETAAKKARIRNAWIDMARKYSTNVFLEIQPHIDDEQKELNIYLLNLACEYKLNIIAANDIHALNRDHDRLRKIVKKGKRNGYDNDDQFELWWKTREEMVSSFREQGVVPDKYIEEALDNTVKVANSVEEFVLDTSHKYPQLYEEPDAEFKKRIKRGLVKRGINKLPKEKQKKYIERVNHEYKVYKHNGAINYMLSHQDILNAAKEHGVKFGYGRGSVSGSLIAYLCGQTEMDSVKLGLNFERFMNPARISLADIDTDMWKPDQQWVQQWILKNPKWHAASIMTANTYGLKAAIKAIADGMDRYAGKPAYIQSIRNQIGDDGFIPSELYEEHQQLIDDAKKVVGVIDSFGRHAAGIVIDTNTIDDTMGTQTISGWDYPVTQVAMKEIDHQNWVKYDMLGLDNMGLISKTAELAGIPFPTPDSDFIDFNDEKVWKSMKDNNIGIFQFEGERAGKILSNLFSDSTLRKIKEKVPKVKYMDLLSLANGAMRPAGSGFIDAVTHGDFKDNGHPALNEFLAPTLGRLVYQEQLMDFLVKFCGFSEEESDLVRRGIGKKDKKIMDEEVPKIKPNFIRTMIEEYGDTREHAEQIAQDFIQVFMDAANYGFSINHAAAYSYIGYISTWLRYYYPLEWCTAAFQIWEDKQDKLLRVTEFAKQHEMAVKPVRFRKSRGQYFMSKNDNSIYEGTAAIKGNNSNDGDLLYLLRDNEYSSFTELLLDIYDNNTLSLSEGENIDMKEVYTQFNEEKISKIDKSIAKSTGEYELVIGKAIVIPSSHMINLISLNFFEEFGPSKKLVQIYDYFRRNYKPKNKRLLGKSQKYKDCLEYEQQLKDEDYPLSIKLKNELDLLGRCITKNDCIPRNLAFVTNVIKRSNKAVVTLYSIQKGVEAQCFISLRDFQQSHLTLGSIIKINSFYTRPKMTKVDGRWIKTDSKELWLKDIAISQ